MIPFAGNNYYSYVELSKKLNITLMTVHRWAKAGYFEGLSIGGRNFVTEDTYDNIEKYLKKNT
jgi:predicted site-specific integrase-resolvase